MANDLNEHDLSTDRLDAEIDKQCCEGMEEDTPEDNAAFWANFKAEEDASIAKYERVASNSCVFVHDSMDAAKEGTVEQPSKEDMEFINDVVDEDGEPIDDAELFDY